MIWKAVAQYYEWRVSIVNFTNFITNELRTLIKTMQGNSATNMNLKDTTKEMSNSNNISIVASFHFNVPYSFKTSLK